MNCQDARTLLHLHRPGERSEAEDRSLAEHLHTCPDCLEELRLLHATMDAMDRIVRTPPPPVHTANETRGIMAAIRADREPAGTFSAILLSLASRSSVRLAYGIVAVVTMAVMGYQLTPPAAIASVQGVRPGPYVAYRVDASDVERLRNLPIPDGVRKELSSDGTLEISKQDLDRTISYFGQAMLHSLSLSDDERRYSALILSSLVRAAEPTIRFGKIGG